MKRIFVILLFLSPVLVMLSINILPVFASPLSDSVNEQTNNLDLSKLIEFFKETKAGSGENFFDYFNNVLDGKINLDYNSFFEYFLSVISYKFREYAPIFFNVVGIAVFCSIINGVKGDLIDVSVYDTVEFICFLISLILILSLIKDIYIETKNTIQNLTKLNEIMSPIILTLMITSGATVSASVYKPSVVFFSNITSGIVLNVILPLIVISLSFMVLSNFNKEIRISKFAEFFTSLIKWIIGIIVFIYGILISISGISSASIDGISVKFFKYAFSNSIPLIGNIVRDGVDIVSLGSIVIKNALGLTGVFFTVYLLISPIITLISVSLLLKITASIIEPLENNRLTSFCSFASSSITYLTVSLITVSVMFVLTVLLMIFSASGIV